MKTNGNYLMVDKNDINLLFQPVSDRTNKGDMGRLLCICGCYDERGVSMCGAAYFAATAAYRCGAGIVEIFTEEHNYAVLASGVPEAVFSLYSGGENRSDVCARLAGEIKKADAVIIGCGLGRSDMSRALVKATLEVAACPLLIDADALNIISEDKALWELMSAEQRARTVITPHPGEMSRLTGKSISEILNDTVDVAQDFAREHGLVCLLKDHNTVISEGKNVYINHSGNAGMATAGMGDVLAGIIGALISRSIDSTDMPYRAAVGAYLHGLAGDIAVEKTGKYSLMARDVIDAISHVIA